MGCCDVGRRFSVHHPYLKTRVNMALTPTPIDTSNTRVNETDLEIVVTPQTPEDKESPSLLPTSTTRFAMVATSASARVQLERNIANSASTAPGTATPVP